ncbi:ribosomal protein S5 domain 2-type protein [Sphaerosporella brunnea]|uniref:Ribosomal RNA-processing protein 43 n=1 Tax=Sphaerosporella brunnea TaxID=1250544 RepID=A0A5J5F4P0_9PEZI|nr:ribosomal protein S5 domain 2-type protein [Sphaerosporella brunnea]
MTTTTSTTTAATMGLSFPAATFQKLSPSSYLQRHLQCTPATRPSGRSPSTFRPATLHTNALSHAHGSAVVRTGDTAVVCGVRGEILALTSGEGRTRGRIVVERVGVEDGEDVEVKTHALVVPNLELGTGCSRDYHPGPPTDFAQTTAERLRTLLLDTVPLVPATTLRIADAVGDVKAYWVLYIDVVVISLDGNVLDTAWAAIVAALKSVRLPAAIWDQDAEAVICDPTPENFRSLELMEVGYTASFVVCENDGEEGGENAEKEWVLSDPDEFEEQVCCEKITVAVGAGGKIVRIEKSGGLSDVAKTLPTCISRARERYQQWHKIIS